MTSALYWCNSCNIPTYHEVCPKCGNKGFYFTTDARPVFPEERLLIEAVLGEPMKFHEHSVWNSNGIYYVDGKKIIFSINSLTTVDLKRIRAILAEYEAENSYDFFYKNITTFIEANRLRYDDITSEAINYIIKSSKGYDPTSMFVSFSGGKDSTVTSHLVRTALSNPSIIHIFGDTTLELPDTIEYVERFKRENRKTPMLTSKNDQQDFFELCKEFGPPSRMLRWCCTIFKTGFISKRIDSTFKRVDNVSFAREIMSKLLSKDLWAECENCPNCSKCPIYFNVFQIRKYQDRVTSAVEAFYRYLYENDKQMTIRQILSQLSFALTGNLTCKDINVIYKDSGKFKYLFSNLFFGYGGIEEIDNADQIQGIAYAKELKLDTKGLNVDYKLFVTGNFSDFPPDIEKLISKQHRLFAKRHLNIDDKDIEFNTDDLKYRRAIRRAFILFGNSQNDKQDNKYLPLYDELFGIGFNSYIRIQNGEADNKLLNSLRNTITDALYLAMTGTSSKMARNIPLTIKRSDDYFQSVMITTGNFKKSNFKVNGTPAETVFEDTNAKHAVKLQFGSDSFKLSLPMVTYFEEIANGMISTISNPSLTHGLSKLKALLKKLSEEADNDEITVIVNNTDKPIELKIIVDDNLLIEDN